MEKQMQNRGVLNLRRKQSYVAVLTALPIMLALQSTNANAACSGSIASPVSAAITVQCNGIDTAGNLNNNSATAYNDTTTTATAGNNTLIQFDGQGRTLTNTGNIINDRIITGTTGARGRTAVLMGAATLNAGAGTVFSTSGAGANLPNTGATTITLNAAPTAAYVGQTVVFGRYNAAEGDFAAGVDRIITAVDVVNRTITFSDALPSDFAGTANSDPIGYLVISNYGVTSTVGGEQYNNVIINSGTISSKITATEINTNRTGAGPFASVSNTAAVRAITMSVQGDYLVRNNASGIISVKHDGIGAAYAIEQGGAVEGLEVNNKGLISAERTAALTLVANSPTANPTATAVIGGNTYSAQTVALVNAINTQEEAEEFTLNNALGGIVRATGDYASAIYLRAGEKNITNAGLIEHLGSKGFAIGSVSNPGDIRALTLENTESGVIKGDILAVNGNALRWYLLSTEGGLAGQNSRLNINSQYGQSDSEINNAGQITGNFHYSNGTHALENEETGVIVGNIDVDQRNTVGLVGAVATNGALAGTKAFSFLNEGSFTGNVTIRTDAGSQVTLIPTVTGNGSGSTQAAPSTDISGTGGTLKVWDGTVSTIATTTTLAPQIANGVAVQNGAWFKVADILFGSDLPSIESTALVDWALAKNLSGNLVLGADVADATTLAGVSSSQGAVINALISSNDRLGGTLQSYTSESDIAAAADQLRPEINGASFQAVNSISDQVLGLVESRLAQTYVAKTAGTTGISTGESGMGVGIWMQGFGFTGELDKRKQIDGYDVDGFGFAFGADKFVELNNNLRLGGVLSYGQSVVDNTGQSRNRIDIDSYQAMIYSALLFDHSYLNTSLSVGNHQFDTKRQVLGNKVTGDYEAWQYAARVDAGWTFKVAKASFIPVASLSYSYLDEDGYTEKGAGALSVRNRDTDSFRSGVGARAIVPLFEGGANGALEVRTIWNHEFADVAQDSTARFAAGGSTFNVKGARPDRDSANLGLTMHVNGTSNHLKQSLLVSYDADIRDHYVSHTGKLQARFDF